MKFKLTTKAISSLALFADVFNLLPAKWSENMFELSAHKWGTVVTMGPEISVFCWKPAENPQAIDNDSAEMGVNCKH